MTLNGGEATEMMRSSSEEPAKKRKRNNLSECEVLFFGDDSDDDDDEDLSTNELVRRNVQQEIVAYRSLKKLAYKNAKTGMYENPLLWWKDYEVVSRGYLL